MVDIVEKSDIQVIIDSVGVNELEQARAVQTTVEGLVTSAAADAAATAADRVQTGLDVIATAADREQTGLDAAATAADRVQTGLDVITIDAAITEALETDITTTTISGTTRTIVINDRRERLRTTSGSAVAIELPNNLPVGFNFMLCQVGVGQVTFNPASGASLHSFQGYSKTAGQWSEVTLTVDSNSDGSSAVWVLSGAVGP